MTRDVLRIEVRDHARGERHVHTFSRSPVFVGRGSENHLRLDAPFVSNCHGVFYFEAGRLEFVDPGSTNGTVVDGEPLERAQRVSLTPVTELRIGELSLRAALGHAEPARVDAQAQPTSAARSVRPSPAPFSASFVEHSTVHRREELREPSATATIEGEPSGEPPSQSVPSATVKALARFFLEMWRGHQQFLEQSGLSSPQRLPFDDVSSVEELLTYFAREGASAATQEALDDAFRQLMQHHLALMAAVKAGAGELLDELAPVSLAVRPGGVGGWLMRVLGRDTRWAAYERRHAELREPAALIGVVLGRAFFRAYGLAAGRSLEPRGSGDETDAS